MKEKGITHPSCTFRKYVNVMILFFTISRSISTVVPCTPWAPFGIGNDPVDEVPDSDGNVCVSQSRARGTVEVGVGADAY